MEVDDRFSKLAKDPSYKKISKKERKVKIDSRFEKMFTDENFQSKFSTDKRGRVVNVDEAEDLHNFYDIDKTDDQENSAKEQVESVEKKSKKKTPKKKGKLLASVTSVPLSSRVKTSGKKEKKKIVGKESSVLEVAESPKVDFDDIRGEALPDESDSDSGVSDAFDDDDEDIDGDGIIHGWGDLDENVKYIENAETSRLAVCNCDWDKIGANDLYILFHSFKPVDGHIKSVKIYPSDFGIERMKDEKINGPKELVETAIDSDNEEKESEEGSRFHMEKLREYQMNRLKYYYAIVECDNDNTANKLYEELDGQEYELSATRLDLRFIPGDTTFDDREPSSIADGISQLDTYEPVNYHNTALQQSTVRLTWDESDTKRTQATMRKFSKEDIENMDFKDYLASSSDEEEEEDIQNKSNDHVTTDTVDDSDDDTEIGDEAKRIEVYKELMQEIESKEDKRCEKPATNVDNDTDQILSFPEISLKNSSQQKGSDSDNSSESEDEASEIENSSEVDSNMDDQAGSQDFNDPFFADTSETDKKTKSKKKGKRSRNECKEELTEDDKKTKNELELLLLDESEDKKHFNLKDIMNREKSKKSKKKRRKEETVEEKDDFELDVSDPRFSALYSSHLYALDPSEPNFKHTKATDAIIEESRKQQDKMIKSTKLSASSKNDIDSNLNGLLRSVKSKTQLHKWKKEKKKLK